MNSRNRKIELLALALWIASGSRHSVGLGLIVALTLLSACSITPRPPPMPEGVAFRALPAKISNKVQLQGVGQLRFRGGVGLQSRDAKFGSYSGLHLSPDRRKLTAVGWGSWLTGTLIYDDTNTLVGFTLENVHPLLDEQGDEVASDSDQDAEALTLVGDSYYVGFETNNRIWRYAGVDQAAKPVPLSPALLRGTPSWGGFSSITSTHDNKLLALTEGGQDDKGNTKGWLWDDSTSGVVWLRAAPGWLPVDMALLPNGDLLLAEVHLGRSKRYDNNRLSRIDRNKVKIGHVMQAETIATLAPPDYYEKIEGVHATRGASGETLIYAISDSSENWPTHLLLFELTEQSL